MSLACSSLSTESKRVSEWDIHNCGHAEFASTPEQSIYLDAKHKQLEEYEHCYAIHDEGKGEFKSYEISVDMMSLESVEGVNSGNVGLIFNFLDELNYDFVYIW